MDERHSGARARLAGAEVSAALSDYNRHEGCSSEVLTDVWWAPLFALNVALSWPVCAQERIGSHDVSIARLQKDPYSAPQQCAENLESCEDQKLR